jgi:3-dehydroquinate synthase
MVCASRLAARLGMIPDDLTRRQVQLLSRFGLPVIPKPWPAEQLLELMRRDKNAQAGTLRFVLPTRLGHVTAVDGVPADDVFAALGGS